MLSRPHVRAAFLSFSPKSTDFSTKMYCLQIIHYFFKIRSTFSAFPVVSYSRRYDITKILSFPYSLLTPNPLFGRQSRAADEATHSVPFSLVRFLRAVHPPRAALSLRASAPPPRRRGALFMFPVRRARGCGPESGRIHPGKGSRRSGPPAPPAQADSPGTTGLRRLR